MIEVRFHGRGGQGAVLACDIMASALLKEGKYAQSFPLFGGERRGAPVRAFLRADKERVVVRGEIYEPDSIMVLDPILLRVSDVITGLKKGGWVIINSPLEPGAFGFSVEYRVAAVDATAIAAKYGLGSPQSRIVNTTILGALARVTGLVSLDSLVRTIKEVIPIKREENAAAAREAYEVVRMSSLRNKV